MVATSPIRMADPWAGRAALSTPKSGSPAALICSCLGAPRVSGLWMHRVPYPRRHPRGSAIFRAQRLADFVGLPGCRLYSAAGRNDPVNPR